MIANFMHILLLVLIVIIGIIAIIFRDLLASIVALSALNLLLSLEFYILQAPDVAISEAAIGAGLTTAIYILSIKRTHRTEEEE